MRTPIKKGLIIHCDRCLTKIETEPTGTLPPEWTHVTAVHREKHKTEMTMIEDDLCPECYEKYRAFRRYRKLADDAIKELRGYCITESSKMEKLKNRVETLENRFPDENNIDFESSNHRE